MASRDCGFPGFLGEKNRVSWEAITALSTAFTGIVIVVTALIGIDQLRQLRAQRRDAAAVELVRSLQDTTFSNAFGLIQSLPVGISAADFHALGARYEEAATILAFRFETIGVLVYRGTISLEITSDVIGGATIGIWQRMKNVAFEVRTEQDWPMYLEWFQWLAEQLESRGRLRETPAYIRLRDWTDPHPPPTR
jgi:hypothetical protein